MIHSSSRRFTAAATVAGAALAAGLLAAPTALAAPAPASFCSDGTQPMATSADVDDFTEGSLAAPGSGTPVTVKTVVKGTEPVTIEGEYIGKLDDGIFLGTDMLLFRFTGDVVDPTGGLPGAGIWAGMSGSPVYTEDGALIGAVSYGLNSSNLPIAGVTPAEAMKKTGTNVVRPAGSSVKVGASVLDAPRATSRALTGSTMRQLKPVKAVAGGAAANEAMNRTLARTPKSVKSAGFLRGRDFTATAASSAVDEPLQAGGNIAVGMATGDGFTGGVGTVTAICGDDVWAFGHPMNWMGKVNYSISNAETALIVPDGTGVTGSYKQVSRVGDPIGMITDDRIAAIKGRIGSVSGYPVTVDVKAPSGQVVDTLRSTVVTRDAGPSVVAQLPYLAVMKNADNWFSGTAKVQWTINYRTSGGTTGSVTNRQTYADAAYLPESVGSDVGNQVATIEFSDAADVQVTGVKVAVTYLSEDVLVQKLSGVQAKVKGSWRPISGAKLKPGRTYKTRPVLKALVNNKPKATVYGPVREFKLSKKAVAKGRILFASASQVMMEAECYEDEDGEIVCEDFDIFSEPKNLSQLIASLKQIVPAERMVGAVQYKVRAGKKTRFAGRTFNADASGIVTGLVSRGFLVRR